MFAGILSFALKRGQRQTFVCSVKTYEYFFCAVYSLRNTGHSKKCIYKVIKIRGVLGTSEDKRVKVKAFTTKAILVAW